MPHRPLKNIQLQAVHNYFGCITVWLYHGLRGQPATTFEGLILIICDDGTHGNRHAYFQSQSNTESMGLHGSSLGFCLADA